MVQILLYIGFSMALNIDSATKIESNWNSSMMLILWGRGIILKNRYMGLKFRVDLFEFMIFAMILGIKREIYFKYFPL